MNKIPDRIYLQIRDEDGKVLDSKINEAVTWCADQINSNDEEYIRSLIRPPAMSARISDERLDWLEDELDDWILDDGSNLQVIHEIQSALRELLDARQKLANLKKAMGEIEELSDWYKANHLPLERNGADAVYDVIYKRFPELKELADE